MQQALPPELPLARGESSSSEILNTNSGSNELVKWDPPKEDAMSAQTTNNHPPTTQKKEQKKRLDSVNEYTVGIITALAHEKAAVIAMLDEEHGPPLDYSPAKHDDNSYSWGMMSGHNVAVASLGAGSYGITQTAHTVAPMLSSLPEMRFGLLVGIGAGIPQDGYDIRLGDVAISVPGSGSGGVKQYDAFKAKQGGELEHIGFLNQPSMISLKGVQALQAKHLKEDSAVPEYLQRMVETWPKLARSTPGNPSFLHQDCANDRLFPTTYHHVRGEKNCGRCESDMEIKRPVRDTWHPEFHYGVIASGNTLVKDSIHRDELVERVPGCICFEMEAAGVMNKLPCLIIRGICDYGDSHKNDIWQNYAAAVAAGYAKELLGEIVAVDVKSSESALAVMNDIKNGLAQVQRTTATIQDDSQMKKLKKWIAPPDTSVAYNNARNRRQPGTCCWFLATEVFKRWKEGSSPLIWIKGIPGSGKTILSSFIVEELKADAQDPSHVVLYFYFEFKPTIDNSLDGLIRNFLTHLFMKNEKVRSNLQGLYEKHSNETPSTDLLVETFRSSVSRFSRVDIVIDALDEVENISNLRTLLGWITATARSSEGRIRLIVTSRNDDEIESSLYNVGETVTMTEDVVKNDIAKYVEKQIDENPDLRRWKKSTKAQDAIKSTLIEKSEGMFRLVVCQLHELRDCANHKELNETLAVLPQTLTEIYTQILERISKHQRKRVITILQLVLFHWDILSIEMARDAIIIDPTQSSAEFDDDKQVFELRDFAKMCGPLVAIDWEKQVSASREEPSGILRIAHFSVREYLTNSDQVHEDFKDAFQESTAYTCFTQMGLSYLRLIPPSEAYRVTMERYPLAEFAMDWPSYAHSVQRNTIVAEAIRCFFTNDAYHTFVQLYNHWDSINTDEFVENEEISDHLWILSSLGLDDCLAAALNESNTTALLHTGGLKLDLGKLRPTFQEFDPLVRICRDWESTPRKERPREHRERALYFAARNGSSSIVKALLAHRVDAHVEGGKKGTALNAAMHFHKPDVVNILQEHYDTLDPKKFTSAVLNTLKFSAQAYRGLPVYSETWVQQALTRITHSESGFNEILRAALLYGNQDLVDLSLGKVQPDVSSKVVGITFVDAIRAGQENCAERILRMVDNSPQYPPNEGLVNSATSVLINTLDEQYGRAALHWAAERGYVGLTKALIQRHAKIDFRDNFDETPLHRAAEHGRTEVAEILIAQGADTKAIDKCFRVPLRSAFLYDHLDTCWTASPSHLGDQSFPSLLNEIDLGNICEDTPQAPQSTERVVDQRWWRTGLQRRIESNYPEARSFLHNISNLYEFRRRVELELESFEENSLFQLVRQLRDAILSGEHERVQEALHGSHVPKVVNARLFQDAMSTPLLLAASKAFHEIFRILLDKGANPTLMDLSGRSAMQNLDPKKYGPHVNIPIFASLVKQGWGLDDPDNPGQTYLDFVKIQNPSPDGTTCLHYAAREGCKEIVSVLLDSGANIGAQNNDGKTPVDYARAADQLDVFGIRLDPLTYPSDTKNMPTALRAIVHEERFAEPQKHTPTTIDLALRLHKAVRANEIDTVRVLLETPDVDLIFVILRDSTGRSALHWAVENRNLRIVQMLLEVGSAVNYDYEGRRLPHDHANIKDDNEKTPLHYAAEAGEMRLVKALVGSGAHAWANDNRGHTPGDLAEIRFLQAVADFLRHEEAKIARRVSEQFDSTV